MNKYWILILLFCFQSNIMLAQQDTLTGMLDSALSATADSLPKYEYWKKNYYKDIKQVDTLLQPTGQSFSDMIGKYQTKDFEYVESISDKISIWKSIFNWIGQFLSDLFPDVQASPGEWFYNILGIAGGAFVIFLLYKFFFSGRQFVMNPKEESTDDESTLEFVEKNLLEIDINTYIANATAANNYPLAIRYQQLLNIQLLAKKDIIAWDQTKTNMELTEEILKEDIKKDFKRCSALFDYVWFGDFQIDSNKFEEITKEFHNFQRRWS